MDKWFPKNAIDFMEERIRFYKACIDGLKQNEHANKVTLGEFYVALIDMEFCLKVYSQDPETSKNHAIWFKICNDHLRKMVLASYSAILDTEFRMANVYGTNFRTNDPAWLPLEAKAYNEQMKKHLSEIFTELNGKRW